jgi:aspartate aminotransferase
MTTAFAKRVSAIQPSATLAMSQKADELRQKGVDVISFGLGEPDFETPTYVRDAAKSAIDRGCSHYTAVRGIKPLLEAIQADSKNRRGGIEHRLDEIVVSVGAKHTLFNLAMALYEPGDEVLVPAPHWVSYPDQVQIFGGTPITLPTDEKDGFRLRPETLASAINERTKALILCSPSNPTGTAYTGEQLRALADVCKRGQFWIIVDEIYGELVYDGFVQRSMLEVAPELKDRLIIVDGVSKTFSMTGWRIGWALAPAAVAKAVEKMQGQSTTNPTAVAQHAAMAALRGDRTEERKMRDAFAERRRVIVDGLNSIPGIRCIEPEGAFYAFPNVAELVGRAAGEQTLSDDVALSLYLLEEARVAVVPGSAFGAPGYLRLSYATSMEKIREGLRRISAAAAKLKP